LDPWRNELDILKELVDDEEASEYELVQIMKRLLPIVGSEISTLLNRCGDDKSRSRLSRVAWAYFSKFTATPGNPENLQRVYGELCLEKRNEEYPVKKTTDTVKRSRRIRSAKNGNLRDAINEEKKELDTDSAEIPTCVASLPIVPKDEEADTHCGPNEDKVDGSPTTEMALSDPRSDQDTVSESFPQLDAKIEGGVTLLGTSSSSIPDENDDERIPKKRKGNDTDRRNDGESGHFGYRRSTKIV